MVSFEYMIRFALGYAKRQGRIAYVYKNGVGNLFVSMHYNGDYLVKVYPGGKRVFSLFGLKLAKQWVDGIVIG